MSGTNQPSMPIHDHKCGGVRHLIITSWGQSKCFMVGQAHQRTCLVGFSYRYMQTCILPNMYRYVEEAYPIPTLTETTFFPRAFPGLSQAFFLPRAIPKPGKFPSAGKVSSWENSWQVHRLVIRTCMGPPDAMLTFDMC